MNGIKEIANCINSELKRRLPKQRKTQRTKLALLVSTMLEVRSANLMDLAAGLPRDADRTDMRYQWIIRLLGNPLVISDEVMEPFAREVLSDQTLRRQGYLEPAAVRVQEKWRACPTAPRANASHPSVMWSKGDSTTWSAQRPSARISYRAATS